MLSSVPFQGTKGISSTCLPGFHRGRPVGNPLDKRLPSPMNSYMPAAHPDFQRIYTALKGGGLFSAWQGDVLRAVEPLMSSCSHPIDGMAPWSRRGTKPAFRSYTGCEGAV